MDEELAIRNTTNPRNRLRCVLMDQLASAGALFLVSCEFDLNLILRFRQMSAM